MGPLRPWTAAMISSGVDALQVDGGCAEVGVAELALDDVQGHAFVGELEGVGVAELVRRKSPADSGMGREAVKREAHTGTGPAAAAGGAIDDAEQRPDRQLGADGEQGRSCSQPHASIPVSRRRPPLPLRTSSDPRCWSRSVSSNDSASWTRSPARQSTTIIVRTR